MRSVEPHVKTRTEIHYVRTHADPGAALTVVPLVRRLRKEDSMTRLGMLLLASVITVSAETAWARGIVSGTIQSIDAQNRELTLDNGKTYTLASSVQLEGLKPGDKVNVSAESEGGMDVVKKIEPSGSPSSTRPAPAPAPMPRE
jgi:Cu/Ag efflux protein CusF